MPKTVRLNGGPPGLVLSRFKWYFPFLMVLWVSCFVFLWIVFVTWTRSWLGDAAMSWGILFATIGTGVHAFFLIVHTVMSVGSSRLVVTDSWFTIRAVKAARCAEVRFQNDEVERVVYGQQLRGMGKLLAAGVKRPIKRVMYDFKGGAVTVIGKDGSRAEFRYFDKAFDERALRTFFKALHANGIEIAETVD